MILVDFNQIMIGCMTGGIEAKELVPTNPLAETMAKHLFLSAIVSLKGKFREYGDVVICCDSKSYWRGDFFPYYKGNRKSKKDKSDFDWSFMHSLMDSMKEDLRENFKYPVIEVPKAEGDDVISCMVKYLQTNELVEEGLFQVPQKIMIISADHDFIQLHGPRVKQYSPRMKAFVKTPPSIKDYLVEDIMRGQPTDGICNMLSDDSCLVLGIKQNSIRKEYVAKVLELGEAAFTTDLERRNWKRNKTLIDFSCIPQHIYDSIIEAYTKYEVKGSKSKMTNYLMKRRMRKLFEDLQNF